MSGQVVSKRQERDYKKFTGLMKEVEADAAIVESRSARFWLNLHEIYAKGLWYVSFPKLEEWIGDLTAQPFGPSRTDFFDVMSKWKMLADQGLDDGDIAFAIGSGKTAVKHDIQKLFVKTGRGQYELKPGVEKALGEEGVDLREKIIEIASQSSGKARKAVSELSGERHLYCHDMAWVDGALLAKIVETGGEKRTVIYDVKVTCEKELSALAQDWITNWLGRSG